MHACGNIHYVGSAVSVCVDVCITGVAPPKTESVPDHVGGFPVDFIRQVVGCTRTQ